MNDSTIADGVTGTEAPAELVCSMCEMKLPPGCRTEFKGDPQCALTSQPDWVTEFCAKWSGYEKVEAGEVLEWLLRNVPTDGVAEAPAPQVCPNHGREPARCNYFDCRGAGKCGELAGWKKGWWKPDAPGVDLPGGGQRG